MSEAAAHGHDRLWGLTDLLVSVAEPDLTLREVNPAWPVLLGWSQAEMVGRSYADFVHPDDVDRALAGTKGLAEGQEAGGERVDLDNRYRCRDGGYRWINWSLTADAGGFHCVGRDITEQKAQAVALARAEDALRQARKMEAVGQLAGGIAHDFNNMLGVVIGSLDLLKGRVALTDQRAIRYVEAASQGAHRAALLTQRLLAFSRGEPARPKAIAVSAVVAGVSDLIRVSLGDAIRLRTDLESNPWPTEADADQLENVLLNLAVNARDAMPEGGDLVIETHNMDLDLHDCAICGEIPPGQYVLIVVADTGEGMSKDVMAKALEPFFTTKAVGKGAGLGLSQVRDFVHKARGYVRLDSGPGRGTCVMLYLPRSNPGACG